MSHDTDPRHLWPGTPPGALDTAPTDLPTLRWFMPAKPSGAIVLVCPGGGYNSLAEHEGAPIAQWLNTLGITGAVLRYRRQPHRHPTPLMDAARAIRALRHRALELNLDSRRVGILGSSAGGHLAATLSTHYDAGNPDAPDPVERHSSRPDLSILLYPVISLHHPYVHSGSRANLLGETPAPADLWDLSNEDRVTPQTPPAFLFHTLDDPIVAAENSVAYTLALRRAGVSAELHIYAHGPHGVGLATDDPALSTWPTLCANWLRVQRFIR